MSSYADAAASSGPTGHPSKIPEPKKVQENYEPLGSVETVDGKEFNRLKAKASQAAEDAVKASKKQAKEVKKELAELEKDARPYLDQAVAFLKEKYAVASDYVSTTLSRENLNSAGKELQNPVVIGQLAAIAAGASAAAFVYSERARIRSDNKYVVAIHAGIVTALVLGDVYVFQQLYPKYRK